MIEEYVRKDRSLLLLQATNNTLAVCTLKLNNGVYKRSQYDLTTFRSPSDCQKEFNNYLSSGTRILKDELKHPVMV